MSIFGIDVQEWASLIATIGGVCAAIGWIFHVSIKGPLNTLTASIKEMNATLEKNRAIEQQHYMDHEHRLAGTDLTLGRMDTRLAKSEEDIKELKGKVE